MSRPVLVPVSAQGSAKDLNRAPASAICLTIANKSKVECARRSIRVTVTTSPAASCRSIFCNSFRSGRAPLGPQARHDLLEIFEDRYGRASTIVTSQLPVEAWHGAINQATYADAILDRLIHNAHRLDLSGESMRRPQGKKTDAAA
jgi:hypothetical protein